MSRRTKTSLARKCFTSLNSSFIMIINKEKENQYLVACMNCILRIRPIATLGVHMDNLHVTGFLNLPALAYIRFYAVTLQQSMFQIPSCIGDSLLC